jgi:hypothetical protein
MQEQQMGQQVHYRVERNGDQWQLVSDDPDRSIVKTGDRDSLVDFAESVVKDVGGEVIVDSYHDGPEAVIRHHGREGNAAARGDQERPD